jgi:hypothetical protein
LSRVFASTWLQSGNRSVSATRPARLPPGKVLLQAGGEIVHLAIPEDDVRILASADRFLGKRLLLAGGAQVGQHVAQAVLREGDARNRIDLLCTAIASRRIGTASSKRATLFSVRPASVKA